MSRFNKMSNVLKCSNINEQKEELKNIILQTDKNSKLNTAVTYGILDKILNSPLLQLSLRVHTNEQLKREVRIWWYIVMYLNKDQKW